MLSETNLSPVPIEVSNNNRYDIVTAGSVLLSGLVGIMQPSKLLAVVVLAVVAAALVSLPIQSAFAATISLTISPNPAPQDGGGTHVTFSGTEAPAKAGAIIYIGIFGYPGCSGGTPFITQSTTEQSSGDYSLILTTSAIGGVGYYSAIAFDPSTNALSACQSFTITYGSTTVSVTKTSFSVQVSVVTTSLTTSSVSTAAATTLPATTLSPVITGTISTTVTTTGSPQGTFTSTLTQIFSTSTSTSQTTSSTFTTTVQTRPAISITLAIVTATSTSFTTATTSTGGTVKVTQTDIFTKLITLILQLLHEVVTKVIEVFQAVFRIVKTPLGRVVHRVTIVRPPR